MTANNTDTAIKPTASRDLQTRETASIKNSHNCYTLKKAEQTTCIGTNKPQQKTGESTLARSWRSNNSCDSAGGNPEWDVIKNVRSVGIIKRDRLETNLPLNAVLLDTACKQRRVNMNWETSNDAQWNNWPTTIVMLPQTFVNCRNRSMKPTRTKGRFYDTYTLLSLLLPLPSTFSFPTTI